MLLELDVIVKVNLPLLPRGMDQDQLDLQSLDTKLLQFSYIGGFSPSSQDRHLWSKISNLKIVPEKLQIYTVGIYICLPSLLLKLINFQI